MKDNAVVLLAAYACTISVCYGQNYSATTGLEANSKSTGGYHVKTEEGSRHHNYVTSESHGNSPAYNFSGIAALLRSRGYNVVEPGDDMPIVLLWNDVALPADRLLFELADVSERTGTSNVIHATWRNKDGSTIIYYFYDVQSKPNRKLFQEAALSWSSNTCIQFKRTEHSSCKEQVENPSFCVGNFGGCWSFVGKSNWGGGKTGLGRSQRLSVSNGCELDACIHEFGHGLGFQHQQSRPDRDKYISVNWENFKIINSKNWEKELSTTWEQGALCREKQVLDIPTPYDYLSVEQYGSFSFVDGDIRPTFVTKDIKHQWMLDYHRSRGLGPSHYDLYVINAAYKCGEAFHQSCVDNGMTVPKCSNYGILTKNCTCKCPAGFTGDTCAKSSGTIYPLMEKAECFIEWYYPGIIDLGMLDLDFGKKPYTNINFNYMQFCTIIIDTRKKDIRPIVRLDPSELLVRRRTLIGILHRNGFVAYVFRQMYLFDCRQFFKLFWTSDKSHRMRTECFSSIFNIGTKITPYKMLSLRSKSGILSMYLNVMYKWSEPSIEILEAAFKLKLQVVFVKIPQEILKLDRNFVKGPSTSDRPDVAPPTIPIELRFETTTPNILGIPLPSIFQDKANPRLTFIAWVLILLGMLIFACFLGACVSEQMQVKELLKAADRRAALTQHDSSSNLLSAGWVRMRRVDVDSEVRKERQQRRIGTNWFTRLFGLNESDSDSDSDETRKATEKKRELPKEKPGERARGQSSSGSSGKHVGRKSRWRRRLSTREESDDSDSSDDSSQQKNRRKRSTFQPQGNDNTTTSKRLGVWGQKPPEPPPKKGIFSKVVLPPIHLTHGQTSQSKKN